MLKLILAGIAVSFTAFVAIHVIVKYRSVTGTVGERLFATTKDSAVLFVQYVTAAVTMLGTGILNLADFFNAPELRQWVGANFSAEMGAGLILVFVLINVVARIRSMAG